MCRFTDWQTSTDEWLPVEPTPTVRDAESTPAAGGPPVTDLDAGGPTEAYHGRRRARPHLVRRWLVVALVVLGLAGAVGLPYLLRSAPAPAGTAATRTDEPEAAARRDGDGGGRDAAGHLVAAGIGTPSASARPSAVPVGTTPAAHHAGTAAPFEVSLEAELVPASLRPNTQ